VDSKKGMAAGRGLALLVIKQEIQSLALTSWGLLLAAVAKVAVQLGGTKAPVTAYERQPAMLF
jgi:hypothetical protein